VANKYQYWTQQLKIMKDIIEQLKIHEGYKSKVYKCTAGVDTIGVGFAIKDLELSEEVCDLILQEKLEVLEERFEKKFDWFKTSPIEVRNVMLNMAYQLGFRGFCKFKKTIAYLEDAEWEKASVEMLDSKWAKQTPNRARELSEIIKSL
jgi:lysozyme